MLLIDFLKAHQLHSFLIHHFLLTSLIATRPSYYRLGIIIIITMI